MTSALKFYIVSAILKEPAIAKCFYASILSHRLLVRGFALHLGGRHTLDADIRRAHLRGHEGCEGA